MDGQTDVEAREEGERESVGDHISGHAAFSTGRMRCADGRQRRAHQTPGPADPRRQQSDFDISPPSTTPCSCERNEGNVCTRLFRHRTDVLWTGEDVCLEREREMCPPTSKNGKAASCFISCIRQHFPALTRTMTCERDCQHSTLCVGVSPLSHMCVCENEFSCLSERVARQKPEKKPDLMHESLLSLFFGVRVPSSTMKSHPLSSLTVISLPDSRIGPGVDESVERTFLCVCAYPCRSVAGVACPFDSL